MEEVRERFVKFKTDTLDIYSIGFDLKPEQGYSLLPVEWKFVEPFFTLEKIAHQYYPVINEGKVKGFRRKELYESSIVKNTEDDVIKAFRSFENFIANARIPFVIEDGSITLLYDRNYFNAIDNQEHLERLTLAKDKVYNLYVTRKGDPFALYQIYEITLAPLLEQGITLPYSGPKEISVYVVAKD